MSRTISNKELNKYIEEDLKLKPFEVKFILDCAVGLIDGIAFNHAKPSVNDKGHHFKILTFKRNEKGEFVAVSKVSWMLVTSLYDKGILDQEKYLDGFYSIYQIKNINRIQGKDIKRVESFLLSELSNSRFTLTKLKACASHYGVDINLDKPINAFKLSMLDGGKLRVPYIVEDLYGHVYKVSDLNSYQWVKIIENTLKCNGIKINSKESYLSSLLR